MLLSCNLEVEVTGQFDISKKFTDQDVMLFPFQTHMTNKKVHLT